MKKFCIFLKYFCTFGRVVSFCCTNFAPGTSFQRNGRSGLRRERYNINNKNDYERHNIEFGNGCYRYFEHLFSRNGFIMPLNIGKIKFLFAHVKKFV